MDNTLNYFENTQNYLVGRSFIRNLMEIGRIPAKLYDSLDHPLLTHMRMMYGTVDWADFVVELDEYTINLILKLFKNCDCYKSLKEKLTPGTKVMIVDNEDMMPVAYNTLKTGSNYVEVLTFEDALDKAAFWFTENLNGDYGGYMLTTIYFLAAFRLALMSGNMDDEHRFSKQRLEANWRHVYASMLWQVGKNLQAEAVNTAKGSHEVNFDLEDYEVEIYKASLEK